MCRAIRTPRGFTLIELSIVLVIIGLIVGGILTGRDLIKSAEVRAQISQIEQFQTAVATFKGKYDYLPGDMPLSNAAQMGFPAGNGSGYVPCDGSAPGLRNGDGLISADGPAFRILPRTEPTLFWFDLSDAKLIPQTFPGNGAVRTGCELWNSYQVLSLAPGPQYVGDYLPTAKIGYGNFVLVFNYSNPVSGWGVASQPDNDNYFTLSPVISTGSDAGSIVVTNISCGGECSSGGVTVGQAEALDRKVDDGKPSTGTVRGDMIFATFGMYPAPNEGAGPNQQPCYIFATNTYAASTNADSFLCGLSFRFAAR